MNRKKRNTVREVVFWSYANLAMAHSAVEKQQDSYTRMSYIIRARLYKGLIDETMNIRSLFDDERVKLSIGLRCSYCGSTENLSLDIHP